MYDPEHKKLPKKQATGEAHSLMFHKKNDQIILMSWARPHSGLDQFSRKEGFIKVNDRMQKLLDRDDILTIHGKERPPTPVSKLDNVLPKKIVEHLHENLLKAAKYFEIGAPIIVFRGDRRTNRIHQFTTDFNKFEEDE